jgi:hypothetical protein
MSNARHLADLLNTSGDVKLTHLDNVPASNDASALTTGTLSADRIAASSLPTAKISGLHTIATSGNAADLNSSSLLPYSIMPAGTTLQTVHHRHNQHVSTNPVNTWHEVSANYRVSITPKFNNSKFLVTYHIPMNPTGSTNILMAISPWWSNNGGSTKNIIAQGTGASNRHNLSVSWFRSNNGFDLNDMQNHVVHFELTPNSTGTLTFGFYFRSEGGNTTYFCHSYGNNNTWGWVAPVYMEVREVRV